VSTKNQFTYPGQPLVIALDILDTFHDLKSARTPSPKSGYPAALASCDVSGAGDAVYNALDLLIDISEKKIGIEDALMWAEDRWKRMVGPGTHNHENAYQVGLERQRMVVDEFVCRAREWGF